LPKKPRATVTSRGSVEYEGYITQEIYIAALPTGKDPDDVLKEGLELWQALIEQASPSLDFYETLILSQADLTAPQGKSFVVRELIPVYRDIEDNVEKTARVQRLARKLGLDERLLLAELKGGQPRSGAQSRRHAQRPPPPPDIPLPSEPPAEMTIPAMAGEPADLGLEEYCLALILANSTALAAANEILEGHGIPGLSANDFRRGDHRDIFKVLQLWTALETPKIETLVEMVDEVLERRLASLANQWHRRPLPPLEEVKQDLSTAILRLRLNTLNEQLGELKILLFEAEENQNIEPARRYRETIREFSQQRKKLHNARDALSLMGKRRAEANFYGQVV
jgi:DNA primase